MRRLPREKLPRESGIALMTSILLVFVLVLMGYASMVASRQLSSSTASFRAQRQATEAAEGGLEWARELVRSELDAGRTLTEMLEEARNGAVLVDSRSLAAFGGTTGVVNATTNRPLVASQAFEGGTLQVFLTNDVADGTTNAVDTNERVVLTAFGSGPEARGFAALQTVVQLPLSGLLLAPALLNLPGPMVSFEIPKTNAQDFSGEDLAPGSNLCAATVAVTSPPAELLVAAEVAERTNQFSTCWDQPPGTRKGVNTVDDVLLNDLAGNVNPYSPLVPNVPTYSGGTLDLIRTAYWNEIVSEVRELADWEGTGGGAADLGTPADPKIVVVNGNFTLSQDGAGILLVTGQMKVVSQVEYRGLVLAVGDGEIRLQGGSLGHFQGAMFAVNTASPWDAQGQWVGTPELEIRGNGKMSLHYDSEWASALPVRQGLPFSIVSYEVLR